MCLKKNTEKNSNRLTESHNSNLCGSLLSGKIFKKFTVVVLY